jgi:hypothetical protein
MANIIDLIYKTNGDILGVFLFICLIIYFNNIANKDLIEYFLLLSSIIALIVDFTIVTKTIFRKESNSAN